MALGIMCVMPTSIAAALDLFSYHAGTIAAIFNCIRMVIVAVVSEMILAFTHANLTIVAVLACICGMGTLGLSVWQWQCRLNRYS